MFKLKATDRPGPANYVNWPGRPKSYTTKSAARIYKTREEAERDKCGNETIVRV